MAQIKQGVPKDLAEENRQSNKPKPLVPGLEEFYMDSEQHRHDTAEILQNVKAFNGSGHMNQYRIVEHEGKAYLVHDVQIDDSLMKLGLKYGVSEKAIMRANKLLND